MWTAEHRRMAARTGLRYPSDLTDDEWALIEPMIPPAKRGGRRREDEQQCDKCDDEGSTRHREIPLGSIIVRLLAWTVNALPFAPSRSHALSSNLPRTSQSGSRARGSAVSVGRGTWLLLWPRRPSFPTTCC